MLVKLELVGKWQDKDAVFLVKEKGYLKSITAVTKIHRLLNHKTKEQMLFAFRNAGKLDNETRQMIDKVIDSCKICKRNSRSKSKPTVAIPRATDFNLVVSFDLKCIRDKYILWMICSFTKFVKGVVVKNKKAETIVKALHGTWCMDLGFPTVGFWCDNGGEFQNMTMEEFINKLGLKI